MKANAIKVTSSPRPAMYLSVSDAARCDERCDGGRERGKDAEGEIEV